MAEKHDVSDEWRLFARSASDDKAPIMAMMAALDFMRAHSLSPSVNVKFLFEGEEEVGSPHLRQFLEKNKDLFQSDALILCDGPVHQTRRMQLLFGARGMIGLEMTVYDPDRALHSGQYVNWAPNPAARTPMDIPFSRALFRTVEKVSGPSLIKMPDIGGSISMHDFAEILGVPVVVLPIVNHDNNQHDPDENLRLRNLWDGIEVFTFLWNFLGNEWQEAESLAGRNNPPTAL